MNKTLKIITILLMTMMVVLCTNTQMVFATGDDPDGDAADKKPATSTGNAAMDVLEDIKPNTTNAEAATTELVGIANKLIGLIQIASAVAAVVLIAVFGFKFILGSANEKADYQKSFIPLIVGVVVVFATTSIAKLLFGLIGG